MSITLKETTSIKLDKESKERAKLIFKELGITMCIFSPIMNTNS